MNPIDLSSVSTALEMNARRLRHQAELTGYQTEAAPKKLAWHADRNQRMAIEFGVAANARHQPSYESLRLAQQYLNAMQVDLPNDTTLQVTRRTLSAAIAR